MNQQSFSLFADKYIRGAVVQEIFYNDETWYGVFRVKVEEATEPAAEDRVVVVGHLPRPHPEEVYTFFGEWKEHPRFGRQFAFSHYERETPKTASGVEKYLASGLFAGIGKKTAKRIVEHLGVDALTVIAEQPEQLEEIPGISRERARQIHLSVLEHQSLERTLVFLYNLGIGVHLALRICHTYKGDTLSVLTETPYRLIEDVEGIGFKRADEIARAVGIAPTSLERLKAACLFLLKEAAYGEGHVFLPTGTLCERVLALLSDCGEHAFRLEQVEEMLLQLAEEHKVKVDGDCVYLSSLFFAEVGLARRLRQFARSGDVPLFPASAFYQALGRIEEELGIAYSEAQKEAVERAIHSPAMLLVGGPGTGKTTVIRGICRVFAELHGISLDPAEYASGEQPFPILLAAPTGRAAKRMSETTGLPAMTVHRLLGWNGEGFEHDQHNPVQGRLLIVDEMSMVDVWLANQLFRALPDDIQVVMVGDPDQLPSVGPGNVLHELIQSRLFPTVRLSDIYRQAKESSIIRLAHEVRQGIVPADLTEPQPDRRFFACAPQDVTEAVKQICRSAVNKGYTAKDIQVLAPIYKGPAGVNQLNQVLQQLFNPPSEQKREVAFGDVVFRTGDKVLQLVNNAEEHVFNGDIGEIVAIFFANENEEREEMIVVSFDGREVAYKRPQYHHLTLAYCCSVHKSQGSEFPIVVMPFVRGYRRMLRRKLVYTGITRSKSYLIMCGEPEAFRAAVESDEEGVRHTRLLERLSADDGTALEPIP